MILCSVKGEDFKNLKNNTVIFICTFDYFGDNRRVYRFKNVCVDNPSLELKDGTEKIVINTLGCQCEENDELNSFVDYVNGNSPSSVYTNELENEVNAVKENSKWRETFMKFNAFRNDCIQEGREEGREEGIKNTIKLAMSYGIPYEKVINDVASQYGCSKEYVEGVYAGKSFATV